MRKNRSGTRVGAIRICCSELERNFRIPEEKIPLVASGNRRAAGGAGPSRLVQIHRYDEFLRSPTKPVSAVNVHQAPRFCCPRKCPPPIVAVSPLHGRERGWAIVITEDRPPRRRAGCPEFVPVGRERGLLNRWYKAYYDKEGRLGRPANPKNVKANRRAGRLSRCSQDLAEFVPRAIR